MGKGPVTVQGSKSLGDCNVRDQGSLSHYLVYTSRWCSLAIFLLVNPHHNLLLVSNRYIQNTYRLVILAVLTETSKLRSTPN
jgi:hypothetical protein